MPHSVVHKEQKGKAENHTAVIGGCAWEKEIAEMWGHHFDQLYNSIHDDRSKNCFTNVLITLLVWTSLLFLCMIYWCVLVNKRKVNL